MIEPEIGEKVTINGITYECEEQQGGRWMFLDCDLRLDHEKGCVDCGVQCNVYSRRDGKQIILKRTK